MQQIALAGLITLLMVFFVWIVRVNKEHSARRKLLTPEQRKTEDIEAEDDLAIW